MHYYYIYHIYDKKIYLINKDSLLITLIHLISWSWSIRKI